MVSEMEELKSQVKKVVYKRGNVLVEDVYKELNHNESDVDAAIARLVVEGKIIYKKDKPVYGPDGAAILLPTLSSVNPYNDGDKNA